MKLLWVFSTFGIGGPQRRAAALIERLGADFEHIIIALDGVHEAEAFLPHSGWRFETIDLRKSAFVSVRNLGEIRRTLDRLNPNLLLTSNWGAIEWSLANRGKTARPHIHFEDGFGPDESPSRQALRRVIMRSLALRGRPIVVPSRTLERVALKMWRLPRSNVIFVPNGVDATALSQADRRPHDDFVTVGSLGALRPEKNYPRLVRAVAAARALSGLDIRLRIHGEGPQRAAIAAAAPDATWLELPGATDNPVEALTDFDIFGLSSDTEQMPLSVIEAMAAGLPVAAIDVGDIKDMTAAPNAGFIHAAADEPRLAEAIATLASDRNLRQSIGAANAIKAAADYSIDVMCDTYRNLFRRVASH